MKRLKVTIFGQKLGDLEQRMIAFPPVKGFSMILAFFAALGLLDINSAAATEEGIALAIVYDTSGSMRETVASGPGKTAAKYIVANKALSTIADRLDRFSTNSPSGSPRKVEVGLYIFRGSSAAPVVPFGPRQPGAIQKWVAGFTDPNGTTPLGNSISVASKAVSASALNHKHVLILTDGMNTSGPPPETVIPMIQRSGTNAPSFHFVAFDVDAKVFEPVKKLGATVLGASNEQQLNSQLEYIFERKILLEDEEPSRPAAVKPK